MKSLIHFESDFLAQVSKYIRLNVPKENVALALKLQLKDLILDIYQSTQSLKRTFDHESMRSASVMTVVAPDLLSMHDDVAPCIESIKQNLKNYDLRKYILAYSPSNKLKKLVLANEQNSSFFKNVFLSDLIKEKNAPRKSKSILKTAFKPWVIEELMSNLNLCLYDLAFGFVDEAPYSAFNQIENLSAEPIPLSPKSVLLTNISTLEGQDVSEASYFLQTLKYAAEKFDVPQIDSINTVLLTLQENPAHSQICIDRVNGLTLEEIGFRNGFTRERVRQIESKYKQLLNIDIHDIDWTHDAIMGLAKDAKTLPSNDTMQKHDAFLASALRFHYLEADNSLQESQKNKIRRTPCKFTDDERVKLVEALGFDKDAEILKAKKWNLPKLIKALHEFAAEIGKPGLMPMQHDMRDHKRLALSPLVQKFGGQSKVAKLAGLIYQGQMVNENGGKTYWTEERMRSFLYEVAEKEGIPGILPSLAQCKKYAPNPVTIGANLMRTGTGKPLTWFAVAEKYGLKYGTSSKERVTLAFVKDFVRALGAEIEHLTPSEVYVLFEQQGITRKFKSNSEPSAFEKLVGAIQSGNLPQEEIKRWVSGEKGDLVEALLSPDTTSIEDAFASVGRDLNKTSNKAKHQNPNDDDYLEDVEQALPVPRVLNTLKSLDKATTLIDQTTSDKEAIDFLIAKAAGKLWTQCFRDEYAALEDAKQFSGNQYAQAARDAFLEEYTRSKQLPLPMGYGL